MAFKAMGLSDITSNSILFYNAEMIPSEQVIAAFGVFRKMENPPTNVKAIPIHGPVGDDILQIVDEDQMKAAGWVRRDKGEKL